MDTRKAIHSRRSVRSFADQAVSPDDVKVLLEAGMMAPSAGNCRPWEFIVIEDREKLKECSSFNPYAGMATKAPLGILVCGNTGREKHPGFWVQDCSAAIQNILLAAVDIGLGAVWTGIYPVEDRVEKISKFFLLPAEVIPLALLVIGHPSVDQKFLSRFEPEKVHYNQWNS